MNFQLNPAIFREYDVRGIAGKDLSSSFAFLLGRAYAKIIAKKKGGTNHKIAIGRDCRLSGEEYATALMSGLRSEGLDVTRLGVCPTPVTYFSIFHLPIDGAIMVTGSHNPADYNGFKICIGKDTLHGEGIQELKREMDALLAKEGNAAVQASAHPMTGKLSEYEIIPPYIDALVKGARGLSKKKIVLDAGNGTAGSVAPELFKRLGADIIPLFCDLDGRFPNHHPDPTVAANLVHMIAAVKREKADFGLAFDGDSDRIGLVDEKGQVIFGDQIMVLFARDVLKNNPGATIISEVKSSHRLFQDIATKGGKPIMWKTGHSLIKSKMKETGALLAGEMSGHIFFADRYYGYDDAIYAGLRVFEIACGHKGPFSTLLADLPPMIATPEIRVDCLEEHKFKLVENAKKLILAKVSHLKGVQITDIDGLRVDFGDGWGLIRASNTQPVLVLRYEAPTQARLLEIRSMVESALQDAAKGLGHPPIVIDGDSAH